VEAKHKQFIRRKLIPFILREHGRGFAMSTWCNNQVPPGEEIEEDEVVRTVPKCGTVACIGGTASLLVGSRVQSVRAAIQALGLPPRQAKGLFYVWEVPEANRDGLVTVDKYGWPILFRQRFARCNTPWGKARVVAALLKEVIRTNGKCLERAYGN